MVDREFIYSVAKAGVTYLQNGGVFYSGPADGPRITPDGYGVAHAIGLNRIRLRLVLNECLSRWQSEVEIRSHNELTKQPYQKDYDAIVTLRVGGKTSTLALEYERTAKAWFAYIEIRPRQRNLWVVGTSRSEGSSDRVSIAGQILQPGRETAKWQVAILTIRSRGPDSGRNRR